MTAPAGWRVVAEVAATDLELVSDRCFADGALGIEERAAGHGRVELLVGMPDEPSARALAARLGDARVQPVLDDGWADAWREWARPVRVRDVVVRPSWIDASVDGSDAVTIAIDPGRAFGDGSHATTRLALGEVLDRVDGGRVLDVGCGGGVLAVAAAVARGARVLALDVDPNAVAATRDNAARNGVSALVEVAGTPLAEVDGPFDFVVANILAVTLRELAVDLVRVVAPGGVVVTSGMLENQAAAVDAAFAAHGARLLATSHEDGWCCRVYTRP